MAIIIIKMKMNFDFLIDKIKLNSYFFKIFFNYSDKIRVLHWQEEYVNSLRLNFYNYDIFSYL